MKLVLLTAFAALLAGSAIAEDTTTSSDNVPVYNSVPYLTPENTTFGGQIEGAAVDKDGNFYAVNYKGSKNETGKVWSKQAPFFKDKKTVDAWFNAIRFHVNSKGVQEAYIGDVSNHRVVRVTSTSSKCSSLRSEDFCKSDNILQPNDIAIAHSTGRLFLSGMSYTENSKVGDGGLWTCDSAGNVKKLGEFYRTNGIEVSPDEKTLYLSEAINKNGSVISNVIKAFDLDPKEGTISKNRTFVDFGKLDKSAATDIDGMRTDIDGNLYVARNGDSKVAKISPSGKLLAYIKTASIKGVANLEFAGAKGQDLFIVGACAKNAEKGCVEIYRADTTGNAFNKLNGAKKA